MCRQGGGNREQRHQERRGTKESRAIPAPEANAELVTSMQKRQSQSSTNRSRSEKFNPHPEEVASGFPIDPPRPSSQASEPNRESQGNIVLPPHKRASHSGPLTRRSASAKGGRRNYQDPSQKVSSIAAADYSAMPGFAATGTSESQQETCRGMSRLPGSFKETSEEANQEENGRRNKQDSVLVSAAFYL